jgi:uncharacterized delta-60 repeat protein
MAAVETLEGRRLLSASGILANAPEGMKLADGGWLYVNPGGGISETTADGSLDLSFGQAGSASVPGVSFSGQGMDAPVNPFALTGAGDILVAGSRSGAGVVARFHADGSLDSAFGDHGVASVQLGSGYPGFFALAIQSDGKIVAVGESFVQNVGGPIWQFTAARFNSDGSIDSGFNGTGSISTALPGTKGFAIGDLADTVAIGKDGKIVIGGTSASMTGPTNPAVGFGLIRLNANGTLDTTFGDGGKVVTYFKDAQAAAVSMDRADMRSLFIRDDGTILAVGAGQDLQVVAAVYNADGSLDANWGIGGRMLVYATSGDAEHTQLTSDGGIEVFDRNDDTLFLTIGPDGKSPNPSPVDPTPGPDDSIAQNPAPTPEPAVPIVTGPAPDPQPIVSYPQPISTGDGDLTTIVLNDPISALPPHVKLHSMHLHRAAAGKLFNGKLAIALKLDPALSLHPTFSIDWGDNSPISPIPLAANSKHPSRAVIDGSHTYQQPGVYTVTINLIYGSSVVKTLTQKIRVHR